MAKTGFHHQHEHIFFFFTKEIGANLYRALIKICRSPGGGGGQINLSQGVDPAFSLQVGDGAVLGEELCESHIAVSRRIEINMIFFLKKCPRWKRRREFHRTLCFRVGGAWLSPTLPL